VSVSTNPPSINHGTGTTLDLAREAAAQEALSMLKEFAIVKNSNTGRLGRLLRCLVAFFSSSRSVKRDRCRAVRRVVLLVKPLDS
jgi:hypothetical protein